MGVVLSEGMRYVASASSLALWLSEYRHTSLEDAQLFGKIYEEAVQKTCWLWNSIQWNQILPIDKITHETECPKCHELFPDNPTKSTMSCGYCHRKWHSQCRQGQLVFHMYPDEDDDYYGGDIDDDHYICHDCVKKQIFDSITAILKHSGAFREHQAMTEAFFDAGMWGLTPRTKFREVSPNYYLAAKPDLYESGVYYEFKTYPMTDFSSYQAKVFAWVLRSPVVLVCWNPNNHTVEWNLYNEWDFSPNGSSIPKTLFNPTFLMMDRIVQ